MRARVFKGVPVEKNKRALIENLIFHSSTTALLTAPAAAAVHGVLGETFDFIHCL